MIITSTLSNTYSRAAVAASGYAATAAGYAGTAGSALYNGAYKVCTYALPVCNFASCAYIGLNMTLSAMEKISGYAVKAVLPVLKIPAGASVKAVAKLTAAHEIAVEAAYKKAEEATQSAFASRMAQHIPYDIKAPVLNAAKKLYGNAASIIGNISNLYLAHTLLAQVSMGVVLGGVLLYGVSLHNNGQLGQKAVSLANKTKSVASTAGKFIGLNAVISAGTYFVTTYASQAYVKLLTVTNFDKHYNLLKVALSSNTYVNAAMPYVKAVGDFAAHYFQVAKNAAAVPFAAAAPYVKAVSNFIAHYALAAKSNVFAAVNAVKTAFTSVYTSVISHRLMQTLFAGLKATLAFVSTSKAIRYTGVGGAALTAAYFADKHLNKSKIFGYAQPRASSAYQAVCTKTGNAYNAVTSAVKEAWKAAGSDDAGPDSSSDGNAVRPA